MNLEKEFNSFLRSKKLKSKDHNFLLAVSGGVDSMVLLNLFLKNKLNFSVATCNFNLRDKESEKDVQLVKSICFENNITFYYKKFNTRNYSDKEKVSIQLASRNLRYDWFKNLLNENNFDYLATAHHKDDSAETILFNLFRTTGYKGLLGISDSKNKIIRPLIAIKKIDLVNYANANNIRWRDDSSNFENKYSRNIIRNEIIPLINKINPSFIKSLIDSSNRLKSVESFINSQIEAFIKNYVTSNQYKIEVSKKFLVDLESYEIILFDFLKKYGFSHSSTLIFLKILHDNNLNRRLFSEKYTLINDRKSFLILDKNYNPKVNFKISKFQNFKYENFYFDNYDGKYFKLIKSNKVAQLNFEKIKFPLTIRNYRAGEQFTPLGMKGKKKISSYLSDIKASYIEKINQLVVLDSNKEIIWLVGLQINEKFKVTDKVNSILHIEIN